jgi:hypothetical protein
VICPSRKLRKTIHELGGTMPANLPVTEPHWIQDEGGQGHYLHDDLRAIELQPEIIQAPPIELWPAVIARVAAPAGVEELLLKPIQVGLQSPSHPQPSSRRQD